MAIEEDRHEEGIELRQPLQSPSRSKSLKTNEDKTIHKTNNLFCTDNVYLNDL